MSGDRAIDDLSLRELAEVLVIWFASPPGSSDRGILARYVDETTPEKILALLTERDALAAKVARAREIVDCMCGHPAGGGCVEATYREAFRAALGDQP